ncbi:hypothetical protein [Candidatus Nitrosotalea okcheonensis]|uniref:Uncharacterized protein n=1 Tax=Candidatus Nitrosotalea okcheonensis TaxID=1903276 RepID=A0A2H1FER1_9ARCH|nr:hypothetical protein [Candidatus Nitrosotalea okcheonensis]SMH71252.1 conserved exported protein of unknown function [Candidatus Nitrosotalea okcheonensis]
MKRIIGLTLISLVLFSSSMMPISFADVVIPGCKVWLGMHTTPSQYNGLPRSNPDGTFYPGDAFDFAITIHWNSWCWSIKPKPISTVGLQIGQIQVLPISSGGGQSFGYTETGHAEIGIGSSAATLSQVVFGYGLICSFNPQAGGTCFRGSTAGSTLYSPKIILPKVTIDLTKQNLTDTDGFMMRNLDGTYYIWDGINIVFNPQYQWKNQRVGTISAHTVYSSDMYLQKDFQCQKKSCSDTLLYSRAKPWTFSYEYAQGQTNWVPETSSDIKKHTFTYETTLYNIGRLIGQSQFAKTDALVVTYDPVYNSSYGYTVLKDNQWWGFGNRPAVAMHYLGSKGGGQDDSDRGIHEYRRSKINSFSYNSYAYRILTPVPLNVTMTWSESHSANFLDDNFAYRDDSLQSGKNSAMFVKSGYGDIIFEHPILFTILKTRYDNSTIINTLQSVNFAGLDKLDLFKYYFGYPHTRFSTDVIVIALHSDGSINHVPIDLKMIPDYSEGATYEQNFIRTKVIHDRDRIFAGIVLNDMYGKENTATGTGVINLQAHLTSMVIPDISQVLAQNPLDLPLNLVYEQPSPYNVTITAGGKRLSFVEHGFEFDTNWRYVINMDQNNTLNSTRYQGMVSIRPDNNFGSYSQVLVDGKIQNITCSTGCIIMLSDRYKNSTVSAYNAWGGKASQTFDVYNSVSQDTTDYNKIATLVLLFSLAVTGYGFVRRYWRGFAAALSFGDGNEDK